MKLLLLSDTHGELEITKKIIEKEQADTVLHMGDVGFCTDELDFVHYVKGNHDEELQEPKDRLVTFCNHKILQTHGDCYEQEVFENLKRKHNDDWLDLDICIHEFIEVLLKEGKKKKADIVCFGHLHQPLIVQKEGIWIVNPGSLAYPYDGKNASYALMLLDEKNVEVLLKYHPWDEK